MACASDPTLPDAPSADWLRGVQLSLPGAAAPLTLEAEAWRSFQPPSTSRGDPLIVIARLTSTAPIDPAVQLDTLYIARDQEVWIGVAREEQPRAASATMVEFVGRNGPNWRPGGSIDVVARVVRPDGTFALLRAPRAAVARVD
ncbi:MAG: hypothetical protein ACT4P7_02995 [Gemmatimonadaceae bacterium]